MDSDSEGSSGAPPWSPRSSGSSDGSSDSNATAPPRSTPYEPNSCQQIDLNTEFEQLAAYLVDKKAPETLQTALQRIHNAYTVASKQTTTNAIHTLQRAVQKLSAQFEAQNNRTHASGPLGASYAAAAQRGAAGTAQGYIEPIKPVPAQHKREIIIT